MPQAPAPLQERWQSDCAAIDHLRSRGYGFSRGGTIIPPKDHTPSEADNSALDYLWLEWDYAVEPAA